MIISTIYTFSHSLYVLQVNDFNKRVGSKRAPKGKWYCSNCKKWIDYCGINILKVLILVIFYLTYLKKKLIILSRVNEGNSRRELSKYCSHNLLFHNLKFTYFHFFQFQQICKILFCCTYSSSWTSFPWLGQSFSSGVVDSSTAESYIS